jgi:acetoin utilization deacetylase AcuC-like enzyme
MPFMGKPFIAWSEIYAHPLPEGHRFPMEKYDLIPQQLIREGIIQADNLFTPGLLGWETASTVHSADYLYKLKHLTLSPSEIRKTGFPLSAKLVQRELHIMDGTVQAALFALEYGVALNVAGGTHHAFTNRGEGFCLLNDVAIAAQYLLNSKLAKQILVIDLDVHQGNGTAEIFRHEPRVFTFSMHSANNYPMHKEQSDLDIGLPDGTDDNTYLTTLYAKLPQLIEQVRPDFVFFNSGVDVLAGDKIGRLGLSMAGCKERDAFVLRTCKACGIPVTIAMGGGYSAKLAHIVDAHVNTFRLAAELYF